MTFEYHRRALDSIAQGSLTNSKRPETLIKGISPTHAIKGNMARLLGCDGRWYIDYICALGTNLFGYANPHIINAVQKQLYDGTLFSLGSTLEVECAELIKNHVRFVSKVRFLKTGTEACNAAIKIARAHTGRDKVLSAGYHGWGDDFVSISPPGIGVPRRTFIEPLLSLDQIKTDIAAVIVEPVITDYSQKRVDWLTQLIDKCHKNDTLVIFDEIITGFRWPNYSFAVDVGLKPDIILFGKAAGGGFPLSIVGLGQNIGEDAEWFVSGTHAGDLIALRAMQKVFEILTSTYRIKDLWKDGQMFLDEFNSLWPDRIRIDGYPTRGVFVGDDMVKAMLWQEAARAGILLGPSFFYGFQHIEHRQVVLSTFRDIIQKIRNNQVTMLGQMPSSPFAQKVRSQ